MLGIFFIFFVIAMKLPAAINGQALNSTTQSQLSNLVLSSYTTTVMNM